jgi:hypothetical protein
VGRGESVAWTAAAHARFAPGAVPVGDWRLDAWTVAVHAAFPDAYERAALEAAAIDLALRQHATNLQTLAGTAPRPVRYVVSFERVADPVARAAAEPAGVELKVDADPAWPDATWRALAATGRVAVLDFKGGGRPAEHERAHRAMPDALLEDPGADPWPATLAGRVSLDIPITSVRALDALGTMPAAVNLKPARMGGVFEALACAARCAERGIAVYLGGMFEVGIGRRQLRALAAVLAPDGPNDIAPLVPPPAASAAGPSSGDRSSRLAPATGPGFG